MWKIAGRYTHAPNIAALVENSVCVASPNYSECLVTTKGQVCYQMAAEESREQSHMRDTPPVSLMMVGTSLEADDSRLRHRWLEGIMVDCNRLSEAAGDEQTKRLTVDRLWNCCPRAGWECCCAVLDMCTSEQPK